jgi:hypothetical protein
LGNFVEKKSIKRPKKAVDGEKRFT